MEKKKAKSKENLLKYKNINRGEKKIPFCFKKCVGGGELSSSLKSNKG